MNTLTIDKKKYVVLSQSRYDKLVKQAALKTPTARKYSLAHGKKMAYALIDKWHNAK